MTFCGNCAAADTGVAKEKNKIIERNLRHAAFAAFGIIPVSLQVQQRPLTKADVVRIVKGALPFRRSAEHLMLSTLLVLGALLAAVGCSRKAPSSSATTSTAPAAAPSQGHSAGGALNYSSLPGVRKTWGIPVKDQPGTVFHIEYSDKTSVVDLPTVARSLRGVTEDHRIFLFEDSPELRAKLIPGKFVLLEGLDLRKVDAFGVDPKTNYLVLGTETAPLREAVKNAQLQWRAPVDFDDLFRQVAADLNPPPTELYGWNLRSFSSRLRDWIQPTVYAGFTNSDIEGEAEIMDSDFATWKCHYHYSRQPGLRHPPPPASNFGQVSHTTLVGTRTLFDTLGDKAGNAITGMGLDLDMRLEREAKGLNASIHVKGHLTKFDQVSSVLMADGALQHASFKNVGLHGYVDLDWEVSTSEAKTPMNEVRLKLPGKISIPLEEEGLPMSLQISEALLFHPAFTTKGEVAKGGFHVNFSGDEGFKLEGPDMEPDGEAQGETAIDQTFAFSPLSAYGLVVALAVPRVELRMGTEELFEMADVPIPQNVAESLSNLLMKVPIAGQWVSNKVGNPLSVEGAAYFQIVLSTTAAHSGMQSIVPCQQFTMVAKGQVGADAVWLGTPTGLSAKDLFTKGLTYRQPDAKICGGGQQQGQ